VLLRGFIGVWSFGMDELAAKLKSEGYDADVYQHDQWPWIARQIERTYAGVARPEPLVIIGHSYGTDDSIRITRKLNEKNIKVNLLALIDPVTPQPIPGNVVRTVSYYQTRGWTDNLPWWRGVPVKLAPGAKGSLQNIDLNTDRQDLLEAHTVHSNIDENAKIHREILRMVAETCPLRSGKTPSRRSH
jgi:pimeloyl-ACP methyl ester carboxylesterase